MMKKPFSQSCENNKQPILQIIETIFLEKTTIWEIGSGTGQHACFFAENLVHLKWQATDRPENLSGINSRLEEAKLTNLLPSLALDVTQSEWPCQRIDALFTANTLHIMHWTEVECFFNGLGKYLTDSARVCIYGPFNYHGKFSSESNQKFDHWLKSRDPDSGIKDIEEIIKLALETKMGLLYDYEMPKNNRLLVFNKV